MDLARNVTTRFARSRKLARRSGRLRFEDNRRRRTAVYLQTRRERARKIAAVKPPFRKVGRPRGSEVASCKNPTVLLGAFESHTDLMLISPKAVSGQCTSRRLLALVDCFRVTGISGLPAGISKACCAPACPAP